MRRRIFSRRDREYVEELILEICERIGLNMRNAGLRDICLNTGWESFLQVYREQPESFRGSGWRGWDSAAKRIREKQLQVKRALDFARYGQVSLNQPARDESTSPRIEYLRTRIGDFQDSVCFWDYIERLDEDEAFLAVRLTEGDTPGEVRELYHWEWNHLLQVSARLREAMLAYYRIT